MTQCARISRILVCLVVITAVAPVTFVAQQTPNIEDILPDSAPISVETLDLEPTVVKTGDRITQTYRMRFPDLIREGKEIIILEDRVAPENLPVYPFDAVSVDIRKRKVGNEHLWDFEYELRLIAPDKGMYVIPAFSFYYLVRDLGEDVEDASVEQVDAAGAVVRYVSTITDVPMLDIRDTIELGRFQIRTTVFRALAWGVAPLPLLLWLLLFVNHARRPKTTSEDQQREFDELEQIEAQIPMAPSVWQARRTLLSSIRALDDLPSGVNGTTLHDVQRNIVISGREYLQAEIQELHPGDTPKDIQQHIEGLKDGQRKDALRTLADSLVAYHSDLEQGVSTPIDDPTGEALALMDSVTRLRPHIRLWSRLRNLFRTG